jgi:3D (Asp-Asp-Asp) domain-containing protein
VRGSTPSLAARILPFAVSGLAAISICAAGVAGAQGAGAQADQLRTRDASLSASARSAVLELYALDSALARAHAEAAAAETRIQTLRRERAAVMVRLGVARRTFRIAERRLGARLRDLYENGSADPVAVLLGADSLDEALSTLDGLHRFASQDRSVIRQARSARALLRALSQRLAIRQAAFERERAQAIATIASLARAQTARRQYLAALVRERALNARRISEIESAAQAARERSARIAPPVPGAPQAAPVAGQTTLTVVATGYSLKGQTATGIATSWGVVAVDPALIPLGTRMTIPGYGEGIAADLGSAVRGATIDLWFPSRAQALVWGRRTVTITLHS